MPRYNIYIRNEDDAKWKAINDKPGWLHDRLNIKEGIPTVRDPKLNIYVPLDSPAGRKIEKNTVYKETKDWGA